MKMRRTSKLLLVLVLCLGILFIGAGTAQAKGGSSKAVTVVQGSDYFVGPLVCHDNFIFRGSQLIGIETDCELIEFEFPFD